MGAYITTIKINLITIKYICYIYEKFKDSGANKTKLQGFHFIIVFLCLERINGCEATSDKIHRTSLHNSLALMHKASQCIHI